jgi:hypothetical protein
VHFLQLLLFRISHQVLPHPGIRDCESGVW